MVDVICGNDSTVIFTASGLIYICGVDVVQNKSIRTPTLHQFYNEKGVKSVVYMKNRDCNALVTMSGELYTSGKGDSGYLGHDGNTSDQLTLKLVKGLSGIVCKQVDLTNEHSAVLTEEGRVYTFGRGSSGQLGHGSREKRDVPTLVRALETIEIKQIQCGYEFTVALSTSGYVYAWGALRSHAFSKESSEEEVLMLPRLIDRLREYNVVQICYCYDLHHHSMVALVDPSVSLIRQAQEDSFNVETSDVIFKVGENVEPIYANIDVLSSKSEYFEAMFRSNMRESIERVVVVPDTSRSAFLKMLEYLCLDDFVVDANHEKISSSSRRELLELADMYMMEGLRLLLSEVCESD